MALLESDSNSASNYISFADGYSINGIDFSDNIIALATGNDGVQLYEWLGVVTLLLMHLLVQMNMLMILKLKVI